MNIDTVNLDKNYFAKQTESQYRKAENSDAASQSQAARPRGDSLEISSAAVTLANRRNKIESGYYDKPEIVRETAERIYNSINKKTQPVEKA